MPKSAALNSKRLISLAPDNWVQWVTQIPNITVKEIINADFQWISREIEVLISEFAGLKARQDYGGLIFGK